MFGHREAAQSVKRGGRGGVRESLRTLESVGGGEVGVRVERVEGFDMTIVSRVCLLGASRLNCR